MRFLFRWIKRLILLAIVLALLLLSPVVYVETMCKGEAVANTYDPVLPPEHHRAESRTLMTYPEWHIVHAYDDYAKVISQADPHDYRYLSGIRGFWSSLCALSETSAAHGGFDWETKQTIYTIGVSFTAELGLKALYEETIGRIFTAVRGPDHSPLDELSARQAADYAAFLQQIPWYRWDFKRDTAELDEANSRSIRDQERRVALGVEYTAKAAYARVIADAVANIGPDALTLRMVVTGLGESALNQREGVTVIAERPEGIEIETPRYRELTNLLVEMANQGAEFVEIAGNDDIMFTALSGFSQSGALYSFKRQGYGDTRYLFLLKVSDLAARLRTLDEDDLQLEHIHDY